MTYFCVDPTNGDDTTGAGNAVQAIAELTPYKSSSAAEAVAVAGDFILRIGGDLELGEQIVSVSGNVGNPITFGSYGTGRGGVDANGDQTAIRLGAKTNLTLNGLELTGGKNVAGSEILYINGVGTVDHNIVVSDFLAHDTAVAELSGIGQAIDIRAGGVTLTNGEIYNCSDDGVYCEGDNIEMSYITVHDVDQSLDIKSGDCMKFSINGTCKNGYIHHCLLDHTNRNRKSAAIIQGSDTGQWMEHTKLMGAESTVFLGAPGGLVRRCLIQPMARGILPPSTIDTDRTDAFIFEGAVDGIIESCIIDSQVFGAPQYFVHGTGTVAGMDNLTIRGNTIYGPLEPGGQGIRIVGTTSGHIIVNNIIGITTGDFNLVCGVNVTMAECDYNIYTEDKSFQYQGQIYTSLAAWKASGNGFDQNSMLLSDLGLTVNDLFEDVANGDFRIRNGQAVLGKQLAYKDFLGRDNFPTIIGAYNARPKFNTDRGLATDRGMASDRGMVTDRGQIDTQYPDWGVRAA